MSWICMHTTWIDPDNGCKWTSQSSLADCVQLWDVHQGFDSYHLISSYTQIWHCSIGPAFRVLKGLKVWGPWASSNHFGQTCVALAARWSTIYGRTPVPTKPSGENYNWRFQPTPTTTRIDKNHHGIWKQNKMKPTNPNAHTYVNGTDVNTHGYAVTHNTFLQ